MDTAQLAGLLPQRRWFGAKGRPIANIEVLDEAVMSDGPPALVFAIVVVTFSDGGSHLYNLPLLIDEDGRTRDAFEDVDSLRLIGELMTQGETIKGNRGMFHFGGPGLDPRSPPGRDSIRMVGTEQSNSSLVLDEAVIVKLFRRVESGANPELELNRLLTNEGFESIPAHVGEILYEGETDETEIDLAIAQQLIVDAVDGWSETLAHVRRLYDAADEKAGDADVAEATEERAGVILGELEKLGDVTASLHSLLAHEELDPAVVAEPIDGSDLKAWAQATAAALQRQLERGTDELARYVDAIELRLVEVTALADAGRKTRVHGDYHLGQVLLGPRGWVILDFEGEPARSLEERRAKQSPLRDVAGMLRSFSYAASAALFERAAPGSSEWERLQPWADAWEDLARQRFLAAYLRTSHEGQFLPAERDTLAVLLDVFEIDKALYEIDYERSHRPDWVNIPLRGVAKSLERGDRR
jgi:trehalose synthase-fused probable maltokinase